MMNNRDSEMFLGDYDDWEYFLEEIDEGETLITLSASSSLSPGSRVPSIPQDRSFSFADYVSPYQGERDRRAAAVEEEKRQRLKKLIGIDEKKRDDTESVETIITPEESESLASVSSVSSSNICLKDIEVSDSQLKLLNIYNIYPIPEDPGLVPGFWILFPKPPVYKEDGIQKFIDLTENMKLQPVRQVLEMLKTDEVNLRHYGLNPRILKALCDAISGNTSVISLDLEDNWLTVDACFHLNELLERNEILSSLSLAGCKIGSKGARRLEEGIGQARALEYLNVSRCELGDEGLQYITVGAHLSNTLQILDLSNNNLGDESAGPLFNLLLKTHTLTKLGLSWNSLFSQEFWETFLQGLINNETLSDLDLSYNALGTDCVPFLSRLLSTPTKILNLNLRGNRLDKNDASLIAKSLMKNSNLEALYLQDNPLGAEGAFEIVKALVPENSPNLKLEILDLDNIWAEKDILPVLKQIKDKRPRLEIKLGGILSNYELIGPDARKIFLKRANFEAMKPKKKKLRKDFGQFAIKLEETIVNRAAFQESVTKYKLKLTDSLVKEIMDAFAIGKDAIDQGALKAFYLKEYPDTREIPPKEKKKKGKKGKKEGDVTEVAETEKPADNVENVEHGKSKHKNKKEGVRFAERR